MSEGIPPVIVWFRRDLRLGDHPALDAACRSGRPVIPVFVHDEAAGGLGAAPAFRLGLGLERLAKALEFRGSRLILRRGAAVETIGRLVDETGARDVLFTGAHDPHQVARDKTLQAVLRDRNVTGKSFCGHLLHEPWTVSTGSGTPHRLYTPFWNSVRRMDVGNSLPEPGRIPAPDSWPVSDTVAHWRLSERMKRGETVVRGYLAPGETEARNRLAAFVSGSLDEYHARRDCLGRTATSGLSDYLALGEISVRSCWNAVAAASTLKQSPAEGAQRFLGELVWREFAHHLMYHTPHILTENWRREWDGFPWSRDPGLGEVVAWKRGCTGVPVVDAAMREMYVTGRMHNRGRMLVASFLTKHLMTHWKTGLDWFAECLVDWDPASNALGWQWTAGSGPDAAPYFRIFNPSVQAGRFDPQQAYIRRWVAEIQSAPGPDALAYFDAVPRSWGLSPTDSYPPPVVSLSEGRARALTAWKARPWGRGPT